ncbi:MAG TPA: hypothetical protein VFT95_05885, partial [Micromonosporaceae bacterium]|nr:hypothetical protein [Micromonosporaceae bacterium]
GVADRVTFTVANAADQYALRAATGGRPVTLATAFQALHDMGRPADALAAVRGLLHQPPMTRAGPPPTAVQATWRPPTSAWRTTWSSTRTPPG